MSHRIGGDDWAQSTGQKSMNNDKNSIEHGISQYHDLDVKTDKASQLKNIYADWADSYDDDNDNALATVSQPNCVALLAKHLGNKQAEILDVGCGTGLVGHHLAQHGFQTFDGTDISKEMLHHATTRGYRNLLECVADQGLPFEDESYDAALCVGVFTHGHVGVEGLSELIRVTRSGGLIAFTVNEGVWHDGGFSDSIENHIKRGHWTELESIKQDYMINEGVQAWYKVMQRT